MKLKLRYYEGKTQVEVNGKWMSLAKAVLHPSVGKEIYKSRDELKEYARKAKELSQIKMLSFTKRSRNLTTYICPQAMHHFMSTTKRWNVLAMIM